MGMMWQGGARAFLSDRNRGADVKVEWPLLKRVFSYFLPYWRHGLVVLACIIAGAAVSLAPAIVTKALIDKALKPGGSYSLVVSLVLLSLLALVVDGLLNVLQSYVRNLISQGIMYDLRNQIFDHLLKQSVGFFTRTKTGDVMSRITSDVAGVQAVVSDTLFDFVSNVFLIATTVFLMLGWSWQLTLVSLAILPLFVLPGQRVGRATFVARRQVQERLGEINAYLAETFGISGFMLVKAFAKGPFERRRFTRMLDEFRRLNIRTAMIGRWFFMMMRLLGSGGPAVLWLFGGYLVVTNRATVGTVVTFSTMLLARLYGPVSQLASLQVNVVGSLALFQRIFEYTDLPVEIADKPGAKALRQVRGEVRFDDVSFSYQRKGKPALENVSFHVEPGQLAALVGPSGAGKTTITSLLPRFHDPLEGSVRIDGVDVRDVTQDSIGEAIGIVFQDTFLFHASVRDNLLYVRPEATQAEIEAATRAANIHAFVESLPDGYDTLVGERGHRLSGGEKQRMAIARVILKDPRILILDEATSNLDSESEHLIQAALKPLFKGRTSLVIAHRLSTVLAADVILVMEGGRLVEQGTHAELVAGDGVYARLYRRQFASTPARVV
jgi:ATP-binding cassette subfamily B protein